MKPKPVEEKKMFQSVDCLYEKKKDAIRRNIFIARKAALTNLFTKYCSFYETTQLSIDDVIRVLADRGDEVIEALTEE